MWVEARNDGQRIRLTVEDDGPGVDPSHREVMLQRGRRLDESVAGHGFGLAIVHEVVELYGGGLDLSDRSPHGLKATLLLPRAAAS